MEGMHKTNIQEGIIVIFTLAKSYSKKLCQNIPRLDV